MSTEDNKALVRRFVHEVLEDLNSNAVDELVAPDFESHTWGLQGDPRHALKEVTERMARALSDIDFRIEDLIAEADRVAVRLTSAASQTGEFHGMPPTGRRYEITEIHMFRIAEDKIAEHWHQYDLPGLMKQLGGEAS